jgi:hypothetical protein
MVDYLENLNKPHNMMVKHFVRRVKVMVWYITDIPFEKVHLNLPETVTLGR